LVVLTSTLIAALVLTACGPTANDTKSATAGLPDLAQSLMAHQWLLVPGDSSLDEVDTNPVTLVFTTDTTASGSAPCNTYRSPVTLDGDDGVSFDQPVTTLEKCEPPTMAAEHAYLDALGQVTTADVTDRKALILTGHDVRLSFSASDTSEQIVGEWSITDLRTPQATRSVLTGTSPTATFGADHTLVVATGCNTLRTRWTLDGSQIAIDPAAQTQMACDAPAGIMDQEVALSTAIEATAAIQVTPSTLALLDDAGSVLVTATR
jgi:heat shock protein HslJ